MIANPGVRAARRRAGLSQDELARRIGVSQSAMSRIELGQVSPRATVVARLVAELGEYGLSLETILAPTVTS